MEKNIEYVEHMIKNIDFNKLGYVYGKESLENLIKGYRDKEEVVNDVKGLAKDLKNYIPKSKIKAIRDKAEVMDYYTLGDVIDDLSKLLEDK